MGVYTVELIGTQEDALLSLTEEAQRGQSDRILPETILLKIIAGGLYAREMTIEQTLQQLRVTGALLPEVIRQRVSAGFTAEQLARLYGLLGQSGAQEEPGERAAERARVSRK